MEENFDLIAQTRANYYTPGSPVQFVCVELLKGDVSGEQAVCLTFRNVSRVTLTALEIHFKCKGVDGVILCEDDFEYLEMDVQPGESFGMDDAVFVTSKAITSVDVSLKNVYNGKCVVHLDAIKRVRLPAPKRLSAEVQAALEARMGRNGMKYMPQMLENGGWYCACGAFHPKEEDTVYCTVCGSDRILLQNALNSLLQPQAQPEAAEYAAGSEATRIQAAPVQESYAVEEEATRVLPPQHREGGEARQEHVRTYQPAARAEDETREVAPVMRRQTPVREALPAQEEYDAYDEADGEDEDSMAEALIRWVPPITAIVCAAIALWGFVYYQFIL